MRFKKILCLLLLLMLFMLLMLPGCIAQTAPAPDEHLLFSDFIMADGALTVFAQGDYVEPYTAIKALIIAQRLGVDVHAAAEAFADWILPFQQTNGPFPRICRSGGNRWLACGPTDADDS
ncbi:MAG TPA: hypothetical protein VNX00_16215, partial [Herbaspirillum sp.]|nr:hypothetical protein [Herbaspirillum sp.]